MLFAREINNFDGHRRNVEICRNPRSSRLTLASRECNCNIYLLIIAEVGSIQWLWCVSKQWTNAGHTQFRWSLVCCAQFTETIGSISIARLMRLFSWFSKFKKRTPTSVQMHGAIFRLKAHSWPLFLATILFFLGSIPPIGKHWAMHRFKTHSICWRRREYPICREIQMSFRCSLFFSWLNYELKYSSLIYVHPARWNSELGHKFRNTEKIHFISDVKRASKCSALFLANHFCFLHIFSIWVDSYKLKPHNNIRSERVKLYIQFSVTQTKGARCCSHLRESADRCECVSVCVRVESKIMPRILY